MNERGPRQIDFLSRPLTEKEFLLYVTQAKQLFKIQDIRIRRLQRHAIWAFSLGAGAWVYILVQCVVSLVNLIQRGV